MNAENHPATGSDEEPSPAQLEQLIALLGEAAAREIVQAVIDEAPGLSKTCTEAMQARQLQLLGRQAHSLKSTSALLGAQGLSRMCSDIEQAAAQGRLDTLDRDVEQMLKRHAQLLNQLRLWLGGHSA